MCVRAGRWVQWGVARAVEERSASVNTGADPTSSRACRTAEGHEIPSHSQVSPVAPVDREKGGEIPELQNVQDDSQQGFTVLPTHTHCSLCRFMWYFCLFVADCLGLVHTLCSSPVRRARLLPLGLLLGPAGGRKHHCPWLTLGRSFCLVLAFYLKEKGTAPTFVWSSGEKVPLPQPLLIGVLFQKSQQLIWRRSRKTCCVPWYSWAPVLQDLLKDWFNIFSCDSS